MNVIFLGGGYGTRLEKDLKLHHPELLGIPKALLPLNGVPLLNYWCKILPAEFSKYIVCNDRFYKQFESWAKTEDFPLDHIYNDGSTSNENRLGAIKDLYLAVQHFGLSKQPILVIAGDTLFLKDFKMSEFLAVRNQESVVTVYTCPDSETPKTGILIVQENRVVGFMEKPQPHETTSRSACPCFYYLVPKDIELLKEFIDNKPLDKVDATGQFIAYLIEKTKINTFKISGRLDIGNLPSYLEAQKYLNSI